MLTIIIDNMFLDSIDHKRGYMRVVNRKLLIKNKFVLYLSISTTIVYKTK